MMRGPMAKRYFCSCSGAFELESIHAKTIITVVPRAYGEQCIHAQTIITFVSMVPGAAVVARCRCRGLHPQCSCCGVRDAV